MRFSHFFVDRPIFATVLSVLIVLVGAIAYVGLPVAQFPEVAPPTIVVNASYPGASAEVVADTVATPIEQEINGVEGMLYLVSQATGDGRLSLTVTFELGTDLDEAQVLVQNRVAIAEPRLPEAVRRLGVTTRKNSPDLMMVIHMYTPDGSRDNLYVSNYARTQVVDRLARIDGVGEARLFAERAFSMRVWLDPELIAARDLTAGEVVNALRQNNLQVASGTLNQLPVPEPGAFELSVQTLGRLTDPSQFGEIVIKTDEDGRSTRVRDIGRVELGAQDYGTNGYLDRDPALPIIIFQRPGSNALETAAAVIEAMEDMSKQFPTGVAYDIIYNPTEFIEESVNAVYTTIFEAVGLVILVIIVFLQSWRASIIPIVAIPVSLIGTFAVMSAFGFSLNNLSLFGLVLAIGIVVDDAIVVVENVERYLKEGLRRTRRRTRRWTRSAARWSRLRWCCPRCSYRRPSSPASPGLLPAVRAHHRERDDHLGGCLAHAFAGAVRAVAQGARSGSSAVRSQQGSSVAVQGLCPRVQLELRPDVERLCRPHPPAGPPGDRHARYLRRPHRAHRPSVRAHPGRLHSRSRPGLFHHRHLPAARRFADPNRRSRETRHRHYPLA